MKENTTPEFGVEVPHQFNLDTFSRAKQKMIATNEAAYKGYRYSLNRRVAKTKEYTPEEINTIVSSTDLTSKQELSRNYFNMDGYYRQIILYYATLLKYAALLIPSPSLGKSLSTPHIQKRYYNALDFMEKMNLPTFFTNCSIEALVSGCYYGIRLDAGKDAFVVMDLPGTYCTTRFKDIFGNDLIEFDTRYFNSITDSKQREEVLALYPKEIRKAYKSWRDGKTDTSTVVIPSEIGICFPLFDGRPVFLSVIPAIINYDDAVDTSQERELDEIHKIVVQKIPHLTDGRLLFEPDEAAEIHAGTVGMLKGNKNVSVLTTYADVDAITSKNAVDRVKDTLDRMEKNIYAQAGVTNQVFASATGAATATSLKHDLAFMMYLANKFSNFVTNVLNEKFANSNIKFKYAIQPITYFNESEVIENAFKLAGLGYSHLMPALAMGMNQKDLVNIKDLENTVLKLGTKLIPLQSSYTQSGEKAEDTDEVEKETNPDKGGHPETPAEKKMDSTTAKDESIAKTGGS